MSFKFVQFGNTNFCNNSCVFCPHKKMKRKKGVMKMNLFRKIVDDLKQYEQNLKGFVMNGFGEPLMDKDLLEKIVYLKSKINAPISFNTNAVLLEDKIAKKLIESGLDEIKISIYATDREEYKKLFGTDNFERVKQNLKNFMERKSQKGTQKPKVIMGFIAPPEAKVSFEEWRNFWRGYADEFVKASTLNYGEGLKYNKIKNCEKLSCLRPQNRFVILWNGDVCVCCFDYEGRIIFGNLREKSIKEIIETEKYQHYLNLHKKNKINELAFCKNCDEPVPATLLNKLKRWVFLRKVGENFSN